MLHRCVRAVAIAILVAGGVTFAQDQGKQGLTTKIEYTVDVPNEEIGPCGGAVIIGRHRAAATEIYRYAEGDSEHPVEMIGHYRAIEPSLYFLDDPSTEGYAQIPGTRTVMGVPGQNETDRIDFVKMMIYGQGNLKQVTVPGYGRIFSETGHIYTDFAWSFLINRGHNDLYDQDVAALCDYLSGR
jgi:hypothetical protein